MKKFDLEKFLTKNENEVLEFKRAENNFDKFELEKYFSALSNEANLQGIEKAYLIFGVDDKINPKTKKRNILGTGYRQNGGLEKLKQEILDVTKDITFLHIYEEKIEEKRIVIFEIPAAKNKPTVARGGLAYARNGESVVVLSNDKQNIIFGHDWSKKICEYDGQVAAIEDLDEEAIKEARKKFAERNSKTSKEEINSWSDEVFLKKAGVMTPRGAISNAAMILLGKKESANYFLRGTAKITWILKNSENKELGGEDFYPPFILSVDKVLAKIRNLPFHHLPNNTLFPTEIYSYDVRVIREALLNCIAHQDYQLNKRISVVEFVSNEGGADRLVFENGGSFIPQTIESVIERDAPQSFYRNRYLVEAMINFIMLEAHGSGIKRMFSEQKKRFFPMPDYDFFDNNVKVVIYGKIIDENYVKILMANFDKIDLFEAISLDKLQKKRVIDKDIADKLKKKNLVEGRYPNLFIAAELAISEEDKVAYIKNKAFNDITNQEFLVKYLRQYGKASRKDVGDILLGRLSNVLSESQKQHKIKNLLYFMHKKGVIKCVQKGKNSIWELCQKLDAN